MEYDDDDEEEKGEWNENKEKIEDELSIYSHYIVHLC